MNLYVELQPGEWRYGDDTPDRAIEVQVCQIIDRKGDWVQLSGVLYHNEMGDDIEMGRVHAHVRALARAGVVQLGARRDT